MNRTVLALFLLFAGFGCAFAEEPHPSEDRFFTIILTDEDRAAYESLSEQERPEWRRRYWASVDPIPTTDENHREREHQQRITEAIRVFRDKHGQFVFDDRARAYIRFGKPTRRERLEGEVLLHEGIRAPHEFWLYGDMILWFEDRRLSGYFEEGLTRVASGIGATDQYLREDTGWQVDEELLFEESFDRFLEVRNIEVDPVLARRYTDRGRHRWREVPEINEYDFEEGKELRFIFDVSHLAGSAGRTVLLIGFLIPLKDVAFEMREGIESAVLQRQAVLYTQDYIPVDARSVNLAHVRDPVSGSNWIATSDSFEADPGSYVLALRVIDPVSKNQGLFKTGVNVPSFEGDSIRISDLVFAGAVTAEGAREGTFARGEYRIVPRPIRIYGPEEDVTIYFEIYHIETGAGGRGLYEVEYTLFGTKAERFVSFFGGSSEGKLEQGIGQAFQTQSPGPTARRHIRLDTTSLPDDRYTLTIDVTDLANGSTDRASAQFVVKR
jgi:GWxTD domain-containing protein